MTESEREYIAAEIRALRGEMSAFVDEQKQRAHLQHIWLKHFINDLEVNPHTQYKVHLWGAIYWLINFPAVTVLFFLAPGVWVEWGLYITLMYSIYANFTTDYGSMSAAMAAYGKGPLPEIPVEPLRPNGNGGNGEAAHR